ncbi:MAG TPA: hypothetical protein GXX36_11960 [Clostridiaceae bacterium]|nr:hypothetical protein [Clostridiaceae bacterium]
MIKKFLQSAKAGEPVFISTVSEAFENLEETEKQLMNCVLTLLENDEKRLFKICLPILNGLGTEEINFVKSYVWAKIYNILSSLGGKEMNIYIDKSNSSLTELATELNQVFYVDSKRSDRRGYGRAVNVIDRMLSALCADAPGFRFNILDISEMPVINKIDTEGREKNRDLGIFKKATENLGGKIICGIDVGGTVIKTVLVKGGKIDSCKEYNWFPAGFRETRQLIEPICLIVRLMRAKVSLESLNIASDAKNELIRDINKALDKNASNDYMFDAVEKAEAFLNGRYVEIDAIGLTFPDVVVKNKIVGGEVYKTRGIRNNPNIDYEKDFLKLTNLNDILRKYIKKDGSVNIINDGSMAAFTAAVENVAAGSSELVADGIFAHTLGTELGTGWINGDGIIPDIPLEVYNFIIDLGSFVEKQYPSDDLRSINNFNTELPGTLQKYCSQSGIFRLAMKYFPRKRPDLYQELFNKGFVIEKEVDGHTGYYVPTEPEDMRKPFLKHMMDLVERENDEANKRIWKDIGAFLAVTWIETEEILNPGTARRVLFGGLVANKRCFELIKEGANEIREGIVLDVADSGMANTSLMKQLKANPEYTVAQFAQAVGAVYFGNLS